MAKVTERLTRCDVTLSALDKTTVVSKNGINGSASHDAMSSKASSVRLSRSLTSIPGSSVHGQVPNKGFGGREESSQTLTDLVCIAGSVGTIVDRHKLDSRSDSGLHVKSQQPLGTSCPEGPQVRHIILNNKNPGYVPTPTTRWCWGAIPLNDVGGNGRTESMNPN